MHSIILLMLLAVVRGEKRSCEENCRSPVSKQSPATTARNCKCLEIYMDWLNAQQSQRMLYAKDPNAIYYEPVKNMDFPNQKPGTVYSRTAEKSPYHNEISFKSIPNIAHQLEQFKHSPFKPNTSIKTKRNKSTHGVYTGSNDTPLYLDINLNESSDNEVSNPNKLYHNQIKDISEKHLKDCLDLHVILHYRNRTEGILLNNDLSENNKVFSKLNDEDLIVEINNKCKQPATIFTESFEEIVRKWSHIHDKINIAAKENDNLFQMNPLVEENKNLYQDDMNAVTESANSTELNTSSWNRKNNKNTSELLNYDKTEKLSNNNKSTTDFPLSDTQSMKSTFGLYIDVSDYATTPEYNSDTTPTDYKDVPSHGDVFITTSTTYNTDLIIDSPADVALIHTFGADKTIVDHTGSIIEHSSEIASVVSDQEPDINSTPIFEQTSFKLLNQETSTETDVKKNITNVEVGPAHTSRLTNSYDNIKRSEYFEGEYDIPKVVTTELSNDTLVSEIDGKEEIPNSDFVNLDADLGQNRSNPSKRITAADEVNKTNSTLINCTTLRANVTDATVNITGNMFFKHGPYYVPARFVQKPDGQIDVSLDLLNLCKSNKSTNNKSKLIEVICNCIATNNDIYNTQDD